MNYKPKAAACGLAMLITLTACSGVGRDSTSGASGECNPGITDTSIKLGASTMQSGPAAAYKALPQATLAYIDEINADGGVTMGDGKTRKIEFISLDDAYDPARTVKNVRKLVEQDQVFAVFQMAGTSPVMSILEYTADEGVPVIFAQASGSQFAEKAADGALLSGTSLPEVAFENSVFAKEIEATNPNAKIAVLYGNDGTGKGSLSTFEAAIAGTNMSIVASESYEQTSTSVDPQIVALANSGADVFMNFGTGTFTTQALKKANELGWSPETYVNSSSTDTASVLIPAGPGAAKGVNSIGWVYDVSSTQNDSTEGMRQWREFAERNKDQVNTGNQIAAMGYVGVELLVEALENFDGCTRSDLFEQVQNMSEFSSSLSLPGVSFNSSPDYPFAITSASTMTFNGEHWVHNDIVTREP